MSKRQPPSRKARKLAMLIAGHRARLKQLRLAFEAAGSLTEAQQAECTELLHLIELNKAQLAKSGITGSEIALLAAKPLVRTPATGRYSKGRSATKGVGVYRLGGRPKLWR